MAKKPLSPEVVSLIKHYQDSQIKLINIIATQEARGNVTAYRKAILSNVNQELGLLNKYAEGWAQDTIPAAYKTGAANTFEAFRRANISVGNVQLNNRAVRTLVENASGQLTDANMFVGRQINDALREAGIEATAQKLSVGDTVKQTKANMLSKMSEKGVVGIKDKAGRNINLSSYAETVARTTTREATNKASLQAVQDLGADLVQITTTFSTCPVCSVYEGRVYSISGQDKRYPPLSKAFPDGYSTIHPNCTHAATPYFEEFDDNAAATMAMSNRPFEVDPKKKASIDSYNKDQAVKTARRADRREWEEARIAAPDITPKTFSGFRAVKKADGQKYADIKNGVKPREIVESPSVVFKKAEFTHYNVAKEPLGKFSKKVVGGGVTNADSVNDLYGQLEYLYTKYPTKQLEGLIIREGGSFGSMGTSGMSLNRSFFNNPAHNISSMGTPEGWAKYNNKFLKDWEKSLREYQLTGDMLKIDSVEDVINEIKENAKYIRHNVSYPGMEVRSVVTHEYGHELTKSSLWDSPIGPEDVVKKQLVEDTLKKAIENGDIYKISMYSKSSPAEFFAESFTVQEMGVEPLPTYIKDMIKEVLK